MATVYDYSAGYPGGAAIVRAGGSGAVRYIGFPGRTKCTSTGELDDFSRNGLGMALVFEEAARNWRDGALGGQRDAVRARAHATAIGFPLGRPIYMAVDQDVVTEAEYIAAMNYLRGAHAALGGPRLTGVYGEASVLDRARREGVAGFFWQTVAWSGGRHTEANIYQRAGQVQVNGVACDINNILTPDWGQHDFLEDRVTPEDIKEIVDGVWARVIPLVQVDNNGTVILNTNGSPKTVNVPASVVLEYSDARAQGSDVTTRKAAANLSGQLSAVLGGISAAHGKLDTLAAQVGALSDDEVNVISAIRAGGQDPETFAALVGPMIHAGATAEEIRDAAEEGTRRAFERAGQPQDGATP